MSFLWTGSDPIQTGVEDDALRPATVAVLRGRVLNRMGGGIGGVRGASSDIRSWAAPPRAPTAATTWPWAAAGR